MIEHAYAQAEIDGLAVFERLAFDAVELGGILRIRVRRGIETIRATFAMTSTPRVARST